MLISVDPLDQVWAVVLGFSATFWGTSLLSVTKVIYIQLAYSLHSKLYVFVHVGGISECLPSVTSKGFECDKSHACDQRPSPVL